MEIQASARYLRIGPRKLRLLTRGLKGLPPAKALAKLQLYPQKGAEFLIKTVKQARANAINNFKLTEEELKIKRVEVGDGPSFKRIDKSHGARFDRGIIKKRTAHLMVTLETKPAKAPEVKKATKTSPKKSQVKEKK
jgi:large subunit ribosomal protein L22